VWWKVLKSYLEEIGFTSLATDETVMTNGNLIMTNGKALVVIGIYVDDMLITGEDDKEINKVAELLKGRFEMKDLGDARNVLGIRIQQKGNKLSIDQSTYAAQIVKEFLYEGSKMFATPMATNAVKVLATDPGNRLDEKETMMFLRLLGKLNWLCHTRPDICFAVHKIQQFSANPGLNHFKALIRILGYIAGTLEYGIIYGYDQEHADGVDDINYYTVDHNIEVHVGTSRKGDDDFQAFSDTDYAADPVNRKSETGILVRIGGGAVCFSSIKQKEATGSTTEAEFCSMAELSKKIRWA
jgi:hypothetical protein